MKIGRHKKKPFVVRPWSYGECPTGDDVLQAWTNRRRSQKDFIWLLSILGELTCFTDCSLAHLGGFGNIAGRKGGLKVFLERETPSLACKYKSISRHARLAYRIKRAFDIYPPAALSLMHPDLPLPKRNNPFVTNHVRKVYRDHFINLPPEWKAFNDVVERHLARRGPFRFKWGPPWPRSEWPRVEEEWRRHVIAPKVLARIKAEHSFYARDDQQFTGTFCGSTPSVMDYD